MFALEYMRVQWTRLSAVHDIEKKNISRWILLEIQWIRLGLGLYGLGLGLMLGLAFGLGLAGNRIKVSISRVKNILSVSIHITETIP